MRILQTIVNGPEPCPYLADQSWTMKYQHIGEMEPGEYERRLRLGWFKFGAFLQRPVCEGCHECLSMRVPMDEWEPNRIQRRTLAKNAELRVEVSTPPLCDPERLLLYNRYRIAQTQEKGWSPTLMDASAYHREFLIGPTEMTEISVWDGSRLKAIVLTDIEPNAIAGVTHYYDPDWRERSIGLFAMLQTFLLARELGKKWVYLGYYVENSPTMGYKLQFRPCELRGWDGTWERVEK